MLSKILSGIYEAHFMYRITEGVGDVRYTVMQITLVNPSKDCFEYLSTTKPPEICCANDDMYESQTGDEQYFYDLGIDRYYVQLEAFQRDNRYLRMLYKGIK